MKRIAIFGGTFDPVHSGHLAIARSLVRMFDLDQFVFLPAFHAPHKPDRKPTSAYHRFAMISLATAKDKNIVVSAHELDKSKSQYTFDTLAELKAMYENEKLFFVMGGDSWQDIKTWKRWEEVLTMSNHIVVTRPGYSIDFTHITDTVCERIVDLRNIDKKDFLKSERQEDAIYVTDAVVFDTSATEVRDDLSDGVLDRTDDVPEEVAKYIEKYELYK